MFFMMINLRYIILFNFYVVSYFILKKYCCYMVKKIMEIFLEVILLIINCICVFYI